jgi:hypothetical protein
MRDRGYAFGTIVGVAAAGALVWVATRLNGDATWRYWAVLGVLAGAGLALAVALRSSSGALGLGSPLGFVVGFVPAAVCVVWIAIAGQPHSNWFRGHITSWSGDIGIGHLVSDMTTFTGALALGLGVVFGSMPVLVARRAPVAAGPADDEATVVGPATRTPSPQREPVVTRSDRADDPTLGQREPRVPVG